MKKYIKLTEDKLESLNYNSLIAITIAGGGAMGDPGAIEIVDNKTNIYLTHFGEIKYEKLQEKLPLLKKISICFGEIKNLEKGWNGFYTGFGNYLFLREKYSKKVLDFVRTNYAEKDTSIRIELYSHWFDALQAIEK